MSSARGTAPRERGRGNTSPAPRGRGSSTSRGRAFNNTAQRGGMASTGHVFGQAASPNISRGQRGSTRATPNGFGPRRPSAQANASTRMRTTGSWQERYQALTTARDKERADAIHRGLIADPEKPRSLSEAITPVGTCQEMCAEFERVQRVVQKDVWAEETDPNHSAFAPTNEEPDESRMVKKFRRSAAGLEEPLPSDLRPPHVLKKTCDYLFNDVIGNAETLAKVHHFVWDRTRAIRTDFSIQQLTRIEDLRIAIECYERIARFHIVSLHQLALPQRPYSKYDWQQEREQLDATLLSLMQYYDDSHGRFEVPNEAEFRAYCVILQLQDRIPDLEDRVQTWPRNVLKDLRVQKALDVYMAACNVLDRQGPIKDALATHLIARQDWQRFWNMVASKEVSYLMACVAEVYFNLVRRTVLAALFRTSRANATIATSDWTLDFLMELLAFDNIDQVYDYCEKFGFSFREQDNAQAYLDLNSVKGKTLPEPAAGIAKQLKTVLVEEKRFGRTISAIIDGLSVQLARNKGLVVEEDDQGMEDVTGGGQERMGIHKEPERGTTKMDEEDSLFMPQTKDAPVTLEPNAAGKRPVSPFSTPSPFTGMSGSGSTFGKPSTFGQPSIVSEGQSVFAARTAEVSMPQGSGDTAKFDFTKAFSATPSNQTESSGFSFLGNSNTVTPSVSKVEPEKSLFQFGATPKKVNPFGFPSSTSAPQSAPGFNFTLGPKPIEHDQEPARTPSPFSGELQQGKSPFQLGGGVQQVKSPFEVGQSAQLGNTFNFSGSTPALEPAVPALTQPPTHQPKAPSLFSGLGRTDNPVQFPSSGTASSTPTPSLFQSLGGSTGQPTSSQWSPNQGLNAPIQSPGDAQRQTTWSALPTDAPSNAATPAPALQTFANGPLEAKAPQPHSTPPVLSPTPVAGHHSTSTLTSFTSGIKRSSSASDNRPKKPSPLSNSITAADEVAVDDSPPEVINEADAHSHAPIDDFESNLTRVANEFFHAPVAGVLHQYLRYHVGNTIREVQEDLERERVNAIADEFRERSLGVRYGKLWRSLFWQQKVFKSGRDRRQRRQRRLQERGSVEQDTFSISGRETRSRSRSGSALQGGSEPYKVDLKMASRWSKPVTDPPATEVGKRPRSSHGPDHAARERTMGHKRLKSTSHVDDRGRIKKPTTTTSQPNGELLKRSSFLALTADKQQGGIKNTTASSYFRLKAMGMHQIDNAASPRGTKRRMSGSFQSSTQTSPPALKTSSLRSPSQEPGAVKALMPPPASAPSRTSQRSDEDETLFARLRAARDNLTQSTAYYKDEVSRDDEFRKSLNASQSSNEYESPSMARARVEARSRLASHAGSEKDVPAYRLRESKFVPREHYSRAIERAKENIDARSRESSRPESRAELHQFDKTVNGPDLSMAFSAPTQSQSQLSPPKTNGFSHYSAPQTQSPWFSQAGPSTTQASQSFQPIDFGHHTTEMSNGNPFLAAGDSFSNVQTCFAPMPGLQAPAPSAPFNQTIKPSQINEALANSFGESHGHGQNHIFSTPGHGQQFGTQNSYLQTQDLSLLSDAEDEDEDDADPSAAHSQINGNGGFEDLIEESEEVSDDGGLGQTFGHSNTYAALAHNGDTEDEEESWDSEDEEEQGYDREEGDYDGFDDEDAIDGDVDEDETQDASDDGYDNPYEFEEESKPMPMPHIPRIPRRSPTPVPNVAMQVTGNNADEPFELSD